MKKELKQLHARVFGMEFHQYIQMEFDKMLAANEYDEAERDYSVAEQFFQSAMCQELNVLIANVEKLQQEKRSYAAEYAFHCGVTAAYEQFFTDAQQFNFSTTLREGLFIVTGMKRHPKYEALAVEVREIYDRLEQELKEAASEHLTSHECAWDERIHYAAISGYYYGYRTGLSLLDRVRPLSTEHMIGKVLLTEYELGITVPQVHQHHKQREK